MLILNIASLVLVVLGGVLLFRRNSLPAHVLLLAGVTVGVVDSVAEHLMVAAILNAAAMGWWAFHLTRSVRGRRAAR